MYSDLDPQKKALVIIFGVIFIVTTWAYLAGGILLMSFSMSVDDATPLTVYRYWTSYSNNPEVIKWLYISITLSALLLLLPFIVILMPKKRSLHGDAKFATSFDVKKSGLLGNDGIIVGKRNGKFLLFGGTQHVILSAPTRSGKGIGIVIPNLLSWLYSVVVLDIKQENWGLTSKYRQMHGQKCYLFNPLAVDGRTHRYNPLGYVRDDENFRVDDVQKIANMLFSNNTGDNAFWEGQARMLFVGIVLFLIETKAHKYGVGHKDAKATFGEVLELSLKGGDPAEYFNVVTKSDEYHYLSLACTQGLSNYASNESEKTRASIMANFRAKFELWMNPIVQKATAANDFDLQKIRKEKISIYIGVTPDNLGRVAPLLNLFFQQLIDLNTREQPSQDPSIKYNCLLLMDEFTTIGKMDVLAKSIGYIAGYGLRMMPIIQSPSQMVEVYGKETAQTFQSNHALSIIYPPKATETDIAESISKWLGYETVKGVSVSSPSGLFNGNRSKSESDQRRALLLPQEITSLGGDTELVVMENVLPIVAKKIQYYKDAVFVSRLKKASPTLAKIKGIPLKSELDKAVQDGELSADVPVLEGFVTKQVAPPQSESKTTATPANNESTNSIESGEQEEQTEFVFNLPIFNENTTDDEIRALALNNLKGIFSRFSETKTFSFDINTEIGATTNE
jgi:type IV secretion system protein VirD4